MPSKDTDGNAGKAVRERRRARMAHHQQSPQGGARINSLNVKPLEERIEKGDDSAFIGISTTMRVKSYIKNVNRQGLSLAVRTCLRDNAAIKNMLDIGCRDNTKSLHLQQTAMAWIPAKNLGTV